MKADPILPLPPVNSKMPGVTSSLLYNGSRFVGHQKSKGNQYDVEVILQVLHFTSEIFSRYVKGLNAITPISRLE